MFHAPDATGKHTVFFSHRVAWYLSRKENCSLWVLHKCDNPPCCNPDHLFDGTYEDNAQDASRKGRKDWKPDHPFRVNPFRQAHGKSAGAKLTNHQVRAMRQLFSEGVSIRTLMERYGASSGTVFGVVHGQLYKHVDGPIEDVGTPHNRGLKDHEVRAIVDMRKQRISMRKIATEFRIETMTVHAICTGKKYRELVSDDDLAEMSGITLHRWNKSTSEAIARIRELRALGWSYDRIAAEVGISAMTVRQHAIDIQVKAIRPGSSAAPA